MTAEDAINVFKEEFCGLEAYCEIHRDGLCLTDNCEVWWAIKALEQCKADIVDVVRCKNCYHYDEESEKCILNNSEMKPMDYCSYGSE